MKTTDKRRIASEIVQKLMKQGHRAVFVGGCVRDMVMNRPVNDYDIATSAPPDIIQKLFKRTISVGAAFGVIAVIEDGETFEVATFRTDAEYADGRHPVSVTFSTLEEDIKRRDFTVNALAYDPVEDKVIDLVNGRQDIEKKIIRTVGNPEERFTEDKLRMLRGIRFAAGLDFDFAPGTWKAICENASKVDAVSAERNYAELTKIITNHGAGRALDMLLESKLLHVLLPEVAAMAGVAQPEQFHPEGDVYTHTKLTLDFIVENTSKIDVIEKVSPELAWAALLHDVGKPPTYCEAEDRIRFDRHVTVGAEMAADICHRFKMSRASTERIERYIKNHMHFINVQQMRESKLKRFLKQDFFNEELALHIADCTASHGDIENYHFCKEKLESYGEDELRPTPLINGDDLLENGYIAGPIFSEILKTVEDEQLEGRLTDKAQAMAFVKLHFNMPEK